MISIIIPYYYKYSNFFYNSYKSIANQTYLDFECIIVTTKDEQGMVDNSIFKNRKFLLCISPSIDQSTKRNCGIKMATGDFIVFLDCDDEYDENFLKICNDIIKKYNPDLTIFNYYRDKSEKKPNPYSDGVLVKTRNECIDNLFAFAVGKKAKYNCLYDSCWSKLFKRSLIMENQVFFSEKMSCAEDSLFVRNYSLYIKNMYILNSYKAYYWRINDKSTMYSPFSGFFDIDFYLMNMLEVVKKAHVFQRESYFKYCSTIFSRRVLFLLALYFEKKVKLKDLCLIFKTNYRAKESLKQLIRLKYVFSKKVKVVFVVIKYHLFFIFPPLLLLMKFAANLKKRT